MRRRISERDHALAIESGRIDGNPFRWTWPVAAFAVVATPLFISVAGQDAFRLPKEVLFYACGIVIMAVAALGVVWNRASFWTRRDLANETIAFPLMIVAWTLIVSLLSTRRPLSAQSLLWVVCSVALFLALFAGAQRRSAAILVVGMLPAVVNGLLSISQALRIWNPLMREEERTTLMSSTIGLLGNSNDVGTFLVPSVVCAIAASVAWSKWRPLWIGCAAVTFFGVLASESLAAILAVVAALIAFALLSPKPVRIAIVSAFVLGGAAVIVAPSQVGQRIKAMQMQLQSGNYETVLSGRLIGSVTAWKMFTDHPITGVGPGAYGYHFFDYAIAAKKRWPGLLRSSIALTNYHEAHNDHLQVLATSGVAGYALLIAAIFSLARSSFAASDRAGERSRFVRLSALPLAAAFSVSALGQFPLEIAAALTAYLFYAALCMAWARPLDRPA